MRKREKDKCEICGKTGYDYSFSAHAINPKTKAKGVIVCPKHEMQAQRHHDNTAID
jgi:hypothetical protein